MLQFIKKFSFLGLIVFSSIAMHSQVGINTVSPDASSSLDVSSVTSGVLVPRMTETQRNNINTPAKGLLIFQNDGQEGFWYYTGTIWTPIDAKGEFISDNGVIYNTTNLNDDFVVGSTSLNNVSGTIDDRRLFFDKGRAAFRAGTNSTASWDQAQLGSNSFAFGFNNEASGPFSISLGRQTIATGDYAVSIGRNNTVTSNNGTSFGFSNEVTADYGTAFGRDNTVSGEYAIAGGLDVTASGLHAVSLGVTGTASGENSFAMGRLNTASGLNSATMGFRNTASSEGAFAFGNVTTASGVNSMAIGNNVQAPSFSEMAVGLFNTIYAPSSTTDSVGTDRIFSIGNGFRVSGTTTRSNAVTVLKNGRVGIGTDSPTETFEIHGSNSFGGDADFDVHSYGSNITSFHIRSAAGTQTNPSPVFNKANANYYNMEAQGYDGTAYRNAAAIRMGSMANNLTSADDMPGRIDFHTSPDGTTSNLLRVRINDQGNVGIGTVIAAIDEKLVVNGKIKATSINFSGLPIFADEAAATSLDTGDLYQTATGEIRIKM